MHFLIKILEFKVHSTLNCTILIFSRSENIKDSRIKPLVLLIVQLKVHSTFNSRNEKCIAFLICTIFIEKTLDFLYKNQLIKKLCFFINL